MTTAIIELVQSSLFWHLCCAQASLLLKVVLHCLSSRIINKQSYLLYDFNRRPRKLQIFVSQGMLNKSQYNHTVGTRQFWTGNMCIFVHSLWHHLQDCCLIAVMSDSSVTPWTAACQAPLSIWFSRKEYWCVRVLSHFSCVLLFATLRSPPGSPVHRLSR